MDLIKRDVGGSAPSIERSTALRRFVAISTLALLGCSYRLWLPTHDYPQVPFIGALRSWPRWIDWVALSAILISMVAMAVIRGRSQHEWKFGLLAFVAFGLSSCLDQHRLQPWAYQASITFLLFALCKPHRVFALMRIIVVSIYLYSAIDKFDFSFMHGIGQKFLAQSIAFVGVDFAELPKIVQTRGTLVMPSIEFLIGVGLLFQRTRKFTLPLATLFHVALILILSPFGLNHKMAVLVWNAFFAVLIWILFSRSQSGELPAEFTIRNRTGQRLGELVTWMVVLLPIMEEFGVYDHWPAWNLYSERVPRMGVFIRRASLVKVHEPARQFAMPSGANDVWARMEIENWSLIALDVPIYPEERFHVGVALDLAARAQLADDIMIAIHSIPNRWNGSKTEEVLIGTEAIRKRAAGFRLNAFPRMANAAILKRE